MPGGSRQSCPAGLAGNAGGQHQAFPEPRGQRRQGRVDHEPRGLRGAAGFQLRRDRLAPEVRQPVHSQRKPVIHPVKRPRAPGGKPENGRSAQARVRDQQRAPLAQTKAREGDFCQLDGNPRQLAQPRSGDMEGEERRDRRLEGVTE